MTSKRNWALVVGLTCSAVFWLVACGGDDEVVPEATTAPAVEETSPARLDSAREKALSELGPEHRANFEEGEDGAIRYSGETEDGAPFVAQLGGDVDVPEGFFDDIPLYPDAVPFSMMEAGEGMTMVTVDSEDDASNIYEFYKTRLEESGWVLENDMNISGGRVMRALKNGQRAVLHIQNTDGGTRVGFMMGGDEG